MTTQASVSREESQKPQRYIPPWKEPYIIALAGSSGSGKTSIAQTIIKRLNVCGFELVVFVANQDNRCHGLF